MDSSENKISTGLIALHIKIWQISFQIFLLMMEIFFYYNAGIITKNNVVLFNFTIHINELFGELFVHNVHHPMLQKVIIL